MTDRAAYLVLWIPVASWLDAAGGRVTVPAHLVGVSVPWVRAAGFAPSCEAEKPELHALRQRVNSEVTEARTT